ncbi:polyprenyl synthetase family protein [Zavarzinia sp. CC-PAN008]|uniref:polyprenyl synthetase family protein n=1 Tax=Zavarzinia sp. CC-PAN008 TaxID=3243332 RepID=UPI003F74605A
MSSEFASLSLEGALADCVESVEHTLNQLLPAPTGHEARVMEAMRYAVLGGGKRLRPFLVLASAHLFGVLRHSALRVAAALECVHVYSLIHDDLPCMDDDDMRRGKPTVHKAFDEATAVLAGDALLTLAFDILADPDTHPDPHVRCELVAKLAHAAGARGMVGGQMIDLAAPGAGYDLAAITRLQQLKTGALISFGAEAGAILGKASETCRHALQHYAHDLGLAFQITDDLIDVEGDAGLAGKAVGKDEAAGKATFVSILGVERARTQAALLADQAVAHLDHFDDKARLLRQLAAHILSRRA